MCFGISLCNNTEKVGCPGNVVCNVRYILGGSGRAFQRCIFSTLPCV